MIDKTCTGGQHPQVCVPDWAPCVWSDNNICQTAKRHSCVYGMLFQSRATSTWTLSLPCNLFTIL